jgi:hypothetical protein
MPAAPAHAATKNVKKSGEAMRLARPWPSGLNSASNSPAASSSSVAA